MTDVYNFVWIDPAPSEQVTQAVARFETNTLVVHDNVAAIILYPSLMTPCIYRPSEADPWLELLLVSSSSRLSAAQVNRQLKVYPGLTAQKTYHPHALFAGTGGNIEVEPAKPDGQRLLKTHKHFAGVVHKLVADRFEQRGFKHYYRVRLRYLALQNARDASELLARGSKDKKQPTESGAALLGETLERLHKFEGYQQLPERGRFAFKMRGESVQVWDEPEEGGEAIERSEPVQAYHPVYVLDAQAPDYLNLGHLTDIHVNSRLDILQCSPARVIPSANENVSPPIEKLIEPTNRSFRRLLAAMASDGEAHALLVGGDLIDHQLNAYAKKRPPANMQAVWDAVDLDKQAARYAPGVDMVAFYSLIVDFCRTSSKPVFGVSGNHDCYLKPFGISPRVLGITRANEGIPADVNLTFYEAALAFGPTWADCEERLPKGDAPSSFKAEWMEWFYSVFTPFSDFRVELTKQQLVCLGWGNDEDMILGGQGLSHLPRAVESISAVQMTLLQQATRTANERRVIALTHFTVASFEDSIPLLRGRQPSEGTIETGVNEYDMGTFEAQRSAFLALLAKREITCILSGHSHRRALYLLGALKSGTRGRGAIWNSLPVTIHDPEDIELDDETPMPALVVSDSAGPYPRYNRYGEFGGWGSDKPSGSVVLFSRAGKVRRVKVVRAKQTEPRLAVAMDYVDVVEGSAWSPGLQTRTFSIVDEEEMRKRGSLGDNDTFYTLQVGLHPELVKAKLRVKGITLFGRYDPKDPTKNAIALQVDGQSEITLLGAQNLAFYNWLKRHEAPDRFVSVTVEWTGNREVARRYKPDHAWNFEVQVESCFDSTQSKRYLLRRPLRSTGGTRWWPEVPDFAWRMR